ncbi:MAG: PRC-barrel domain-containing protein [Kiloniellales bacterium]
MHKVKLLSTAAAAALLFGIAGATAATNGPLPGNVQLAQTSQSPEPGAQTGGASDTGPQSDVTEPEPQVSPDVSSDSEPGTEGSTMGQTGDTTPMSEQELATRADEIIGQQVVNQQGEEIGEINDLVVDENNQPYAVIGIGGFLGIGERNVAVPVSNLEFGADQVVYNGFSTAEEFETMPEYQEGTWRSLQQ